MQLWENISDHLERILDVGKIVEPSRFPVKEKKYSFEGLYKGIPTTIALTIVAITCSHTTLLGHSNVSTAKRLEEIAWPLGAL